ncbi:hypothetical protein F5878DRAFT_672521 [Lentinula raphanica]|uniref:Uncharacterized protein n=1 Tax=Lentinula raphanica TaxID=153919 RepID=A0AA38UJK7_9AGAR|nr:hypothetical protein F5878DRAFT_672521 [Lentinula raphanica]
MNDKETKPVTVTICDRIGDGDGLCELPKNDTNDVSIDGETGAMVQKDAPDDVGVDTGDSYSSVRTCIQKVRAHSPPPHNKLSQMMLKNSRFWAESAVVRTELAAINHFLTELTTWNVLIVLTTSKPSCLAEVKFVSLASAAKGEVATARISWQRRGRYHLYQSPRMRLLPLDEVATARISAEKEVATACISFEDKVAISHNIAEDNAVTTARISAKDEAATARISAEDEAATACISAEDEAATARISTCYYLYQQQDNFPTYIARLIVRFT